MGEYKLSRIYFENYKVFKQKELIFADCSLAVFDGPNGYGKTSVFDAIEFVITGNIKRVAENVVIIKNDTFETVFIAGNPKKDVIIKAEFISQNKETLVIAKVIPGVNKTKKAKKNNPTKLSEITNTYILPSYDVSEYNEDYKCEQSDIEREIGPDVIQFFSLFYYIRQEDRLAFLNKTETDRMSGINRLFNMEKEQQDFDDSKKALRQLNKIYKDLGDVIEKENNEVKKLEETLTKEIDNIDVKYEQIFTWKKEHILWDQQTISMNDENKKNEIINAVKEIETFIKHFTEFQIDERNNWSTKLIDNKDNFIYYLFLVSLDDTFDNIKDIYNSIKFLKTGEQEFKDGKYNLDYKKICKIVDANTNLELIIEIVNQIQNYKKGSNELAQAASAINQSRSILNEKALKFANEHVLEGQCPYCGYEWGANELLIIQIDKMTESFNKFSDENTTLKEKKINELKSIFNKDILPKIDEFLEKYSNIDNKISEYVFDSKNDIENEYKKFITDCKKYNINIEELMKSNDSKLIETTNILEKKLFNLIKPVSEEYIKAKEQISFSNIYYEYFYSNLDYVSIVTFERIIRKINYVEYNYYNATFQKIELHKKSISQYKSKFDLIGDEIIPKTEKYKELLQSKIESYQSQIIKNIEIPFYIYTGRIMQSYQGGIGVLIKEPEHKNTDNDDVTGLKSIRFISPSRPDHDILYTFSSGQLSSVIIAFTLALNKIYSNEILKCIFIDDPVQTMDELNIASFVELLRNEFGDRQIILSTHEDSFSRYVRYKYEKYNLNAEPITLKNS